MTYKIIPEQIIKDSAFVAMKSEGANNSFVRLLKAAEEYRQANLTPVFILDTYNMDVVVVAKETYKKRLH
jgi:hypothetical protein